MARIIAYPQVTPAADDYLVGTQKSTGASTSNLTKNFTVADVVAAGNSVKEVTTSLTNAQWLTLEDPFPLVAAQGTNKAIRLIRAAILFDFVSSNFTWNQSLAIRYAGTTSPNLAQLSIFPGNTVSQDSIYEMSAGLLNVAPLPLNTSLILQQTQLGALGGDGSIKVKVTYDVLDYNNF